ncbi:MAG: hypothetical protein K5924_08755 [Chloroflexi bacterium]|nr:hypothetical protein [Chloroflexota bacterium]
MNASWELEAWISSHPYDGEEAARQARAAERTREAWLRGCAVGAYCVNRAIFEHLHALEGYAPLRDVPVDRHAAAPIRRRLRASVDAWLSAWREFEAGRRVSPTFSIPDLDDPPPSLEGRRREAAPAYRNSARRAEQRMRRQTP